MKGEILEPKLVILNANEGSKRGPYKSRAASTDSVKIASSVVKYVEIKGKCYLKLTNSNMLQELWRDKYE